MLAHVTVSGRPPPSVGSLAWQLDHVSLIKQLHAVHHAVVMAAKAGAVMATGK